MDLGFETFRNITVRLLDINAYETRGEHKALGKLATEEVEKLFSMGGEVVVTTVKTRKGSDQRGKYGRYLARIEINGIDIGQHLLERGLAVSY